MSNILEQIGIECHGHMPGGGTIWEIRTDKSYTISIHYAHYGANPSEYKKYKSITGLPRNKQWFNLISLEFITKEKELKKLDKLLDAWDKNSDNRHKIHQMSEMVFYCEFLQCTHCKAMFTAPRGWTSGEQIAFEVIKIGWSVKSCSQYGTIGIYCTKCTKAAKKGKKLKYDCHLKTGMKYDYGQDEH